MRFAWVFGFLGSRMGRFTDKAKRYAQVKIHTKYIKTKLPSSTHIFASLTFKSYDQRNEHVVIKQFKHGNNWNFTWALVGIDRLRFDARASRGRVHTKFRIKAASKGIHE